MSGTFPANPPADKATVRSLTPTLTSLTHSLKRQVRSRGAQRWAIKLGWSALERNLFAPIFGFSVKQRGQYETFQIVVPGYTTPLGTWAGTPVVSGGSQSGRQVLLSGFTAGATGKVGDFFKFVGHTKVYMLVEDFVIGGTGIGTIIFEPALMVAPASLEGIVPPFCPSPGRHNRPP